MSESPFTSTSLMRQSAYLRLGVGEKAVWALPRITPHIQQIRRQLIRIGNARQGTNSPLANFPNNPYYFLQASNDPEARKVLDAYYSIPKAYRARLPIEAFCLAAGVSTLRVLEIITGTCVRLGAQASSMIAAVTHPRVVEKTVEMALTDEGHEDRATLHKATGFLPSPKGAQTNIQVVQHASATANAQAASVAAPPPEQTIRRLVDRFNDARQIQSVERPSLPEDIARDRIPATMPHESFVEVESGDDNE